MHPRSYLEAFMRYEAKNQVFVAMPFTAMFQRAFEDVIQPAIERVTYGGMPLTARVINRATSGAPDIHEQIFDAILHSRMVIADMTVQCHATGDDGVARWQANANVAYEVGLAVAWRNPEDVLLIHQRNENHRYSFDVQNLRHVEYDPSRPESVADLSREIVHALQQSRFLSTRAFQRIIEGVSPTAVHFLHEEARRAFPVVSFTSSAMPLVDARIHAATELLACGALKNRHVVRQGAGKGVALVYEWTELGLRLLASLQAATPERVQEIRRQVASVPPGQLPPPVLRDLPDPTPAEELHVDMVEAAAASETKDAP